MAMGIRLPETSSLGELNFLAFDLNFFFHEPHRVADRPYSLCLFRGEMKLKRLLQGQNKGEMLCGIPSLKRHGRGIREDLLCGDSKDIRRNTLHSLSDIYHQNFAPARTRTLIHSGHAISAFCKSRVHSDPSLLLASCWNPCCA